MKIQKKGLRCLAVDVVAKKVAMRIFTFPDFRNDFEKGVVLDKRF